MLENFLAAPDWSFKRVLRIGMATYFVSVVLGLVDGPTLAVLFEPFMSGIAAHLIAIAVLAALWVCILMGWYRSAATIVLALLLFVGSYLHLSTGLLESDHYRNEAVPMFWRDFSIIVLLLLTYSDAVDEFGETVGPSRRVSVSAPRAAPRPEVAMGPITPLSRGSVQQSFHVSPTGRAVSRQLTVDDQRRLDGDVIEAG
jgi:hypothetical protein